MRKNVAGQRFFFQAINATSGAAITAGVTGTVAIDSGADGAIGGSVTHVANGKWRCDPSQADTNGDYLGFSFSATDMIPVTANFDTTPQAASVIQWNDDAAAVKVGVTSGLPQTDAVALADGLQSALDLRDFADAGYDPVTNKVEGVKLVDTTTLNSDMLTIQDVADAMKTEPTDALPTEDNSVIDYLTTLVALGETAQTVEHTRTSDVLTTGTPTGTSANTLLQDGVYWQITSVAAGIDAELIFNIGTTGEVPLSMAMFGRFDAGQSRVIQMQAYNFIQDSWENLGAPLGNEDSDLNYVRTLNISHVRAGQAGTPGVDGDVRLRFLYDLTVSNKVNTNDDFYMDKVAVYANREVISLADLLEGLIESNPQRNYPDSAIHIDTENGQPGQSFGFNGTPGYPVNNLPDAFALAVTGGYTKFFINGNSAILLDQAYPDWTFVVAASATIDFNGQDVDNSVFVGGNLTGAIVDGATGIKAAAATLNGITAKGVFVGCQLPIANSITCQGATFLHDSSSVRPGLANPSINGNGVAGLKISVVKWGGGIDIGGLAGDAEVTMSGAGSFGLTDAATTATVIMSGNARRVGSLPTGINLTEDARVAQSGVNDQMVDALTIDTIPELAQAALPTNPTIASGLMAIYMALANDIDTTATMKEFHNAAGTVVFKKPLSDDGTTYTEAKAVSGP